MPHKDFFGRKRVQTWRQRKEWRGGGEMGVFRLPLCVRGSRRMKGPER